ncbi:MAG: hypothetical protein GC161_14055 [Planctomycetaceae bacterium]|nr:hypothetical protein [Planctomycetaceae bacterium]
MLIPQGHRLGWLLAVAAALCLLGAVGALVGTHLTQRPAAPVVQSSPPAPDEQPRPTTPAAVRGDRQSVSVGASAHAAPPARPDPNAGTQAEERRGAVTGTLSNHLGEILVQHRVLFLRGQDFGGDRVRSALTDADGYFHAERLEVGTWSVFYAGPKSAGSAAAVHLGDVDVHAEQLSQFHLVLVGDRQLRGTYRIRDEEGIGLELELRRVGDGRVVGRGLAVDLEPPGGRGPLPPEAEAQEADRDTSRDGSGPGSFAFRGLAPEPHVLRVVLGKDKRGRPMAVEHLLDLTEGDLVLVEEPTLEQFFRRVLAPK